MEVADLIRLAIDLTIRKTKQFYTQKYWNYDYSHYLIPQILRAKLTLKMPRISNMFIAIKNWKKLATMLLLLLALVACQSHSPNGTPFDSDTDLNNQRDTIVLLHGMWRSSVAMEPAEKFLKTKGYKVVNLSYPSTEFAIETLVDEYLQPAMEELQIKPGQKVHFVTHSMGGILVRYYLKNNQVDYIGRVVMIAPPNQGTELAGLFEDSSWVNVKRGPAATQLSSEAHSWVKSLGPVNFELGVIAGNKNNNWVTDWLLPGDDDGVVTVESTKVENMQDFMIVPVKHYRIRGNDLVLNQAAYFLKHGRFYRHDG